MNAPGVPERFAVSAVDWTRTSTRSLPLAPQASVSTNSTTTAHELVEQGNLTMKTN